MTRRLLTASFVALLVIGLLPLPALAAVPAASGVNKTTDEDAQVTITLTGTDDYPGDTADAFAVVADVAHGTLGAIQPVGCTGDAPSTCTATVDYTPDADFFGSDGFTYTATSGDGTSAAAAVSITVEPVNDPPSFTVGTDATVNEDSGAYTGNGFIADGSAGPGNEAQTLSYELTPSDPSLFAAGPAVSAAGTLTFTPAADANGSTSVDIVANDGDLSTGTQAFTITVNPVNDPPTFTKGPNVIVPPTDPVTRAGWATAISPGPGESDGLSFDVLAATDTLFTVQPQIDATTGDLTFTPSGVEGTTSVAVTLTDDGTPAKSSVQRTFTVTLSDGPIADPQLLSVVEDSSANAVTLTGSDPQDQPLTFAIAASPSHGALSGVAPDLTYTPAPNYVGPDSFTYTATDGTTVSPAATVSITVTSGDNDPVDARSDQVYVRATATTKLDLFKANGGSPDSAGPFEPVDQLTVTAFPTKPAHGTVSITDAGKTVTYDPAGCYVGSDSFQYTITDGSSTDTATVFVGVSRPGQHGFATTPMTDTPNAAFVSNSTIGTTVPLKLSWCGVTTSTTSVRSYHVVQSTNAGSTYPTTLYSATTARSAVRNATVNTSYRWKAQTVDTASRKGAYRASLVSRVRRIQDTSSAIGYTGSWVTSTTSSASGGSEKASKASGATATLTVSNARSFAIVGPRSSTRGSFRVYVDGTLVATVSEKATTTVYRRVLYVRNITSTQSHVIRIVAASSARIDLDAILTLSAQ